MPLRIDAPTTIGAVEKPTPSAAARWGAPAVFYRVRL
jgi:hypothetical protein